jgi:hypothetical protein
MVLHPFVPPPFCIFNKQEITIDNEVIEVGEGVEAEIREEMSEEEGETSATSPRRVSVARILTTNNHISGLGWKVTLENQDNTLRLLMFHGMGKDVAKQHWFPWEEI